MADGLNRWFGFGNLGADAELVVTKSGTAVLKMRLACSESYLDNNKQRQERTEWVSCVMFGRRAEALSRFLPKGTRVFVEGKLRTSKYQDRDGNDRYKTEVVLDNLILCGSSGGGGGGGGGGQRSQTQGGGGQPGGFGGGYDDSDYGHGDLDIPF